MNYLSIPWFFPPDRRQPLAPQIRSYVIGLINEGQLAPGQKMLTIADFAKILNVNKKTIAAVYKTLSMQKILERRLPFGYFVSLRRPLPSRREESPLAAFSFNDPLPTYNPSRSAIPYITLGNDSSGLVLGSSEKHLQEYRKIFTRVPSCEDDSVISLAISSIISYLGMHAEANQFHIVQSLGRNLNVAVMSLLKRSSGVVMASPDDVRAIASFQIVKAEIFFTGFDREGMLMDELEKICLRQQVKVVFIRPAAGIPNGLPLSQARCRQLMALADKHHFVIIEKYNEHEFWPGPTPITFWDTYNKGRVIYLGAVSRMTYPLNSIGIIVGPADFMVTLRSIAKSFSVPDRVSELLLANMVRQGTFSRLQDDMLRQYQVRSSAVDIILRNSLSGLATYTMPTAGFVVWVELCEEFDPAPVLDELAELGLYSPDALTGFYTGKPVKAFMVCFGSTAVEKLKSGIKLIAESIKNGSLKIVPAFLAALAAA